MYVPTETLVHAGPAPPVGTYDSGQSSCVPEVAELVKPVSEPFSRPVMRTVRAPRFPAGSTDHRSTGVVGWFIR